MNEPQEAAAVPVTREDLERAKAAIIEVISEQNTETRAHIGSEVATLRGDVGHTKNFTSRTFTAIKKLLNRFGIGTDDL